MEAREVLFFAFVYAHFHPGRANCPQRAANLTAPSGFLCGAARGPTVLLRRPESGVAMRIKRYEVVPGSALERGPPFFDKPTPSTQFRCVSCPNVFTVPGDERHAVDNGGALGKWKRCDPCSPNQGATYRRLFAAKAADDGATTTLDDSTKAPLCVPAVAAPLLCVLSPIAVSPNSATTATALAKRPRDGEIECACGDDAKGAEPVQPLLCHRMPAAEGLPTNHEDAIGWTVRLSNESFGRIISYNRLDGLATLRSADGREWREDLRRTNVVVTDRTPLSSTEAALLSRRREQPIMPQRGEYADATIRVGGTYDGATIRVGACYQASLRPGAAQTGDRDRGEVLLSSPDAAFCPRARSR